MFTAPEVRQPSYHILRHDDGDVLIHIAQPVPTLVEGQVVDVEISDTGIVLRQGEIRLDLGAIQPMTMGIVRPAKEIMLVEHRSGEGALGRVVVHQVNRPGKVAA